MEKVKIGLISTSQLSFPGDKKSLFGASIKALEAMAVRMGFELCVISGNTLISPEDAESAVREAQARKVDLLLAQCTSFSAGFLAPILAKVKNAYLGLWAIEEGASEGVVPFNSFCSINMYSAIIGNYLRDHDIPFKWFYGNPGHELFDDRLEVTVRALTAIKNIRSAKVALIGGIAPGFDDLYFDERKLLKTFDGLKINRLHEFSEIKDRALRYKLPELEEVIRDMSKDAHSIHPKAAPLLETNARFYKAYKDFISENGYDGIAVSCWPKFQSDFNYSVCSVIAGLNDDGIVAACEGDIPSAVSMLILKYLSDDKTMLMDLSAFDESDETVLMWHCGPASKRFASDGKYDLGVNYHGLPHEEGCAPNCCGVTRDMVFMPGHVTIARLAGEFDQMFLAEGDFIDREKKSFFGSRGWLENLMLNRESISVRCFINTILVQRFAHHYPIVYGDYSREISELAAWLNLRLVRKIPYEQYMQRESV